MDLEKELKYFREERNKVEQTEHFPAVLLATVYKSVIAILDDIISDLPDHESDRGRLITKYRELYSILGSKSLEMTDSRYSWARYHNLLLPPRQKIPVPDPSEQEIYLSMCLKYIYSAQYAFEGKNDGWNKNLNNNN